MNVVLVPLGVEVKHVCQRCVIDGRCSNGKTYSWDSSGIRVGACNCWCHSRLESKEEGRG